MSTGSSSSPASLLIDFLNSSPSPYHAVSSAEGLLRAAGFTRLSERDAWGASTLSPGGRYYVVRNQSAVLAFAVGKRYVPGGGFSIAAAHTDSPCLRVKPCSALSKPGGYLSVGVETYGGGIWATWLDRDLSLAGRVVVASPEGGATSALVRIRHPILRIPSLAIHLNREVNTEGMKLNAESHLAPILCSVLKARLEGGSGGGEPAAAAAAAEPAGTAGAASRHHAPLVALLAAELGCAPADVRDFDLCLYDTQPAALGGLFREWVWSARLDNLGMTYTTMAGLVDSLAPASEGVEEDETTVRIAASFDHEECGSSSVPGAGSTMLEDTMRRLCPDPTVFMGEGGRGWVGGGGGGGGWGGSGKIASNSWPPHPLSRPLGKTRPPHLSRHLLDPRCTQSPPSPPHTPQAPSAAPSSSAPTWRMRCTPTTLHSTRRTTGP